MKITREQREALYRIYQRTPIDAFHHRINCKHQTPITYRQFRRKAFTSFGCVMIQWCGMYLGIETDGHTHS